MRRPRLRNSFSAAGSATMLPLNGYLLCSSLFGALGGLLFGFDTAVIYGATKALSETSHYRLGSFTHWFMNALISAVFPVMAARSGAVPFALFAVMMLVRFLIVLTLYQETNGVSLEKMEHHL
jgi:hypothetical protein